MAILKSRAADQKTMSRVREYSASSELRDGRKIEIRALTPDDRIGFLAAVDRTSTQSLYRRFFASRRKFTDQEIHDYLHVDFVSHVALVASLQEGAQGVIVGGARYILVQPGRAEVALTVEDAYQGRGIGAILMRHLVNIAREAGLKVLIAEVLPDNAAMLNLFAKSGLEISTVREFGVVHVSLFLSRA
jgi:ribosomal protein S18 acetylase RimI-like enzyme